MRSFSIERLLRLERHNKKALVLAVDAIICVCTAYAALYLRLGFWLAPNADVLFATGGAVLLALPIFVRMGLYGAIFRHTGPAAMLAIVRACLVYGIAYSAVFTFIGVATVPRTVGFIQPVLLFLTIAASRLSAFYLLGGIGSADRPEAERARVLIYGAGETGRQLATSLNRSPEFVLLGFFDDDVSLHSGKLEGVPVYDPRNAREVAKALEADEVMLAVPTASRARRREIVDQLRPANLTIRTLPSLVGIAKGEIQVSDVRPLTIEDLLGRTPVEPDETLLRRNVTGKVVMVTGGGGSIGSELCRQIIRLDPALLIVLDSGEFNLYAIEQELRAIVGSPTSIAAVLASVQDEARMDAVMRAYRPATIYHAAAYKHVPLVEENCLEGLRNNVLGTRCAARLAAKHGADDFVLISTDKAVRPTNVMGASKRWAELAVKGIWSQNPGTRFSIVRFGNVLGSSGSVVPLFRRQIAEGGPVTLTDAEVTRYFMTIPEASQLVLQAGAMAEGGEVFVLDMGEPIAIRDLAVNMIELSGLTVRSPDNPAGDIELTYVGLRPGEKLHEELLIGDDPQPTTHPRIIRSRERVLSHRILDHAAGDLEAAVRDGDAERAIALLRAVVDNYVPGERYAAIAPADLDEIHREAAPAK